MRSKTNGRIQRAQNLKHVQGEGLNWIFIVGGALLSTLSIRLGCKLKQAFECRRPDNVRNTLEENGTTMAKRRSGPCPLHSNLCCFTQEEDSCYHHRLSGMSEGGGVDIKQASTSPSSNGDMTLPLVAIPLTNSTKENGGVMWSPSPDRLEARKTFHHSNSSDSPRVSESGSDIFIKREVINKLRQQLKRRDEMIMEMQAQITDLQNSLSAQMTQSAHLQSQFDSANQDLFDSEREIQQLRKVIADHCLADAGSPKKSMATQNWHVEAMNGHANGYFDNTNDLEMHGVGVEKGKYAERVEMLKQEVGELKEVIEGKEFLLQSYKEQKVELCTKIKELQLRLTSHVPNIL